MKSSSLIPPDARSLLSVLKERLRTEDLFLRLIINSNLTHDPLKSSNTFRILHPKL